MADLWEYFKNLFRKAEESSPANPYIHELISRTEEEQADYERWKKTLVCRRLQGWLADQYAIYRVLPEDIDEAVDFLDSPSAKGFAIHFHQTQYSLRDATHMFDYLKEKVLTLNYRVQISDTRTYNRDSRIETTERHYLKPRPELVEETGKMKQQFGNITIELLLRNDRPYNLKFRANIYKDYQFEEAEDFGELMQIVLG